MAEAEEEVRWAVGCEGMCLSTLLLPPVPLV
jgi:hypothetical protein